MNVPQRVLDSVVNSSEADWHQHGNGGGWVYRTATVAPSAYLHPISVVYGAWANIGDGAQIGVEAQIGAWANIGAWAKWLTNPPQIQGSRHIVTLYSLSQIAIGCHVHDISEWQDKFEAIGRKEGYSKEHIEEYGLHIAHMAALAKLLAVSK